MASKRWAVGGGAVGGGAIDCGVVAGTVGGGAVGRQASKQAAHGKQHMASSVASKQAVGGGAVGGGAIDGGAVGGAVGGGAVGKQDPETNIVRRFAPPRARERRNARLSGSARRASQRC